MESILVWRRQADIAASSYVGVYTCCMKLYLPATLHHLVHCLRVAMAPAMQDLLLLLLLLKSLNLDWLRLFFLSLKFAWIYT